MNYPNTPDDVVNQMDGPFVQLLGSTRLCTYISGGGLTTDFAIVGDTVEQIVAWLTSNGYSIGQIVQVAGVSDGSSKMIPELYVSTANSIASIIDNQMDGKVINL